MADDIISRICAGCSVLGGSQCISCTEYISWDKRIKGAEEVLSRMREHQAKILTHINAAHDPFIRLPMELKTLIFEFSVPKLNPDADTEDLTVYELSAPLVLAGVCRSWRDIAFSFPRLWTELRFSVAAMLSPVRLNLAREWLERSCGRPLSITIKYESRYPDEGMADFEVYINHIANEQRFMNRLCEGYAQYYGKREIFQDKVSPFEIYARFVELISACSDRWETLRIDCPSELLSHFEGDATRGALNLWKLELYHNRRSLVDDPIDIQWGESSSKASVLLNPRHIRLEGYSHSVLAPSQWANVTDLRIDDTGFFGGLLYALSNAPNLINCEVVYSRASLFLELPGLESYGSTVGDESLRLLANVTLPSLTNLKLWAVPETSPLALTLVPFLERSRSPLTSLSIVITACLEHELVEVLSGAYSLQKLDVQVKYPEAVVHSAVRNLLITKLAETTTADSFLPRLHTLSYSSDFAPRSAIRFQTPWTELLDIFGQPREWASPSRRPFQHLSVSNIPYDRVNCGLPCRCHIDRYLDILAISRIQQLKSQTQYTVEAFSEYDNRARKQHDLIELSFDHYKRRGIPIFEIELENETDTESLPDLEYPDIVDPTLEHYQLSTITCHVDVVIYDCN